jgi:hypothetical protein
MLEFFRRLFKIQRKVVMVDYDNRVAHFTTHDYPESGVLILADYNRTVVLPIDGFCKNGDVYNLQTEKGLYLLRYL